MNNIKKLMSILLSLVLIISNVSYIYADEEDTVEKEETVYAFLDENGNFKSATVSEWLHSEGGFNNVKDESILEDIKNLKGDEEPNKNGNSLIWNSDKSDIYYQGTTTKALPLNMEITYYFNDKKVDINDVVGQSGKLEIHIKLINNEEKTEIINGKTRHISTLFPCVILTNLKTDVFEDVKADDAIIVNESKNQVVSFVTVSGASGLLNDSSISELDDIKDKLKDEFVISANVTDLEMPSIYCAVSGMMDFDSNDFDASDLDELKDGLNDLQSAMDEILDGSNDLYNAVNGDLISGVNDLNDGAKQLYDGTKELKDGLATLVSNNEELTSGAYTVFETLCNTATSQINASLSANGLDTITLTPENYDEVLEGLLKMFNADEVYNTAKQTALEKVTAAVDEMGDSIYTAYVNSSSDALIKQALASKAEDIYKSYIVNMVSEAFKAQQPDANEDTINAYLASEAGQQAIASALEALTDEQKSQIFDAYYNQVISDEESKNQVISQIVSSLSDDQKSQIRQGIIDNQMNSEDVQNQINEAVSTVSSAAASITTLKGQLDSYNTFYNGVIDYTNGAYAAFSGSEDLKYGAGQLYDGTNTLKDGVADLNDGAKKLNDGLIKFNNEGISELNNKVNGAIDDLDDVVDVVNEVLDKSVEYNNYAGADTSMETSVKFIMKTDEAKVKEETTVENKEEDIVAKEETTSFWQRLINLFKKNK